MTVNDKHPDDLADLIRVSARIGADPHIIQGAGGNTSIKDDGVMWIKASGTQLAEAERRDIFVPTDLPKMRAAIESGAANADRPAEFLLGDHTLRPSIETSLHAVFPHRVVIHAHCIHTIAHAVRADGEALLLPKLAGFDWCYVPYSKPGADLANAVRAALGPDTDVAVLANHGLIVAANSVAAADALQAKTIAALTLSAAQPHLPDLAALQDAAPALYETPPQDNVIHQLAFGAGRIQQVTSGSLYPDHVLFCGIAAVAMPLDDLVRIPADNAPVFVIVPGRGVLIRKDASEANWALTTCLADVLLRIPEDAKLTYLSDEQNYELLDWDAEKYRFSLNAD